jgi:hypothetical protein
VRQKAEELLAGDSHAEPQLTILCTADPHTIEYFGRLDGVRLIPLLPDQSKRIMRDVRALKWDVLYTFWTGEGRYRGMKLRALRIPARTVTVDIGDGGSFLLGGKAFLRFWLFRLRHRLPTDHYEFVPPRETLVGTPYYKGEKVLIVQSAGPVHVLRGLQRLSERHLFRNPQYTLFCRNDPEIVGQFSGHGMIQEIRSHTETRRGWEHWRDLRRRRFDAVVVFFTGDPSYWKVKYFAFSVGARHKLIFNENGDCFFFSVRSWLEFLAHRMGESSRPGIRPHWTDQARAILFIMTKLLLFPFRFVWLLLVWVRLRSAGSRV